MSDAPFQVTGHSASQAANRFGSAPSDPSAPTLGNPGARRDRPGPLSRPIRDGGGCSGDHRSR
jgi:hypothetical protein